MTELAQNKKFKKPPFKALFEQTFALLNEVLGDDAFKRYSVKKNRHEGGFLLSLYETIGLGIAFNIAAGTLCSKTKIAERARSLWSNSDFTDWATAGVTATRRLPRLIPLGRDLFKK